MNGEQVAVENYTYNAIPPFFTIDEVVTNNQQMSQGTFEGLSEVVDSCDDYMFNRWSSLELLNDD